MARPRKPGDPTKWPHPCQRCGEHHQIAATWPDGGICGYCYQKAKRTRGVCACGHDGVLPGRIDDQPACRRCSGVQLNIDCRVCGNEDELYSGGRCFGCTLGATVDRLLTNPETGVIAPELDAIATALKSMKRANSGLTWIQQKHVTTFLTDLSTAPTITHETLDRLPPSRTREYVRGLLVEHSALPRREEALIRYQQWSSDALTRVATPQHREIIRRYIRWYHLRRMHSMDSVSLGTFLRAKQTLTVAIEFVNYLTGHDVELADLQQHHLDTWQASGTTTNEIASRFLRWAITTKLVDPTLTMTPHRRGTSPTLDADGQTDVVQRVTRTGNLNPRDRAAAILVIVFGQQIERVVTLTWNQVTVTDELVTIQLGDTAIALPEPLAEPFRQLHTSPTHDLTAAHPNSNWVFRGNTPGRHIHAASLRNQLRNIFSTRAARLGTLHELTKLAPVAIIAETLGYSTTTIERHAMASSASYAQYIASKRNGSRRSGVQDE